MATDPVLSGVGTGLGALAIGANPFVALGLGVISLFGGMSANKAEEAFLSQQAALAVVQGNRQQAAAKSMLSANRLQQSKDVFDIVRERRRFVNRAVSKELFIQSASQQRGLSGSSVEAAGRTSVGTQRVSQLNVSRGNQLFQEELFRIQQERLLILGGFVDERLDDLGAITGPGPTLQEQVGQVTLSPSLSGTPPESEDPFEEFREEFF